MTDPSLRRHAPGQADPAGDSSPTPDPRDVKDRRETGWMGIASACLVAVAGAGLLIEGGTGGGLLLALIGAGAIVFAVVVVVVSWRYGHVL